MTLQPSFAQKTFWDPQNTATCPPHTWLYSLLAPAPIQLPPQLSGDGLQVHEVAEASASTLSVGKNRLPSCHAHCHVTPAVTSLPHPDAGEASPTPTPSHTGGSRLP